jgi:hypothetical protein
VSHENQEQTGMKGSTGLALILVGALAATPANAQQNGKFPYKEQWDKRFHLTPLSNGAKLLYKEIDLRYQVIGKGPQWHTRKLTGEFQMARVRKG